MQIFNMKGLATVGNLFDIADMTRLHVRRSATVEVMAEMSALRSTGFHKERFDVAYSRSSVSQFGVVAFNILDLFRLEIYTE